eukprot:4082070-Lingulodinium_polyedra.AAC.1
MLDSATLQALMLAGYAGKGTCTAPPVATLKQGLEALEAVQPAPGGGAYPVAPPGSLASAGPLLP